MVVRYRTVLKGKLRSCFAEMATVIPTITNISSRGEAHYRCEIRIFDPKKTSEIKTFRAKANGCRSCAHGGCSSATRG